MTDDGRWSISSRTEQPPVIKLLAKECHRNLHEFKASKYSFNNSMSVL